MTPDSQTHVIASIETAIAHLAEALEELDRTPFSDRAATGLVARALDNYLTVSDASLNLLAGALRSNVDPDVATWLDGLRRLGHMMRHTMGRLAYAAEPADFPLHLEALDLARLMTRACQYYAPSAARKRLEVICRPVGDVPAVWADRAAVAVVADNLLSNAVKHSRPDGNIVVQLVTGPGGVVCSIRDNGPGLNSIQQELLRESGRAGAGRAGKPSPGHGLTIARELVGRMGGQLWFDHDATLGPCFSFRLPYPPAEADAS